MRVYIASLSDYNNGRLEGKWFDLSDYLSASDLMNDIHDMLQDLTKKYKNVDGEVREEWAVHDYEGIPPTLASEYMGEPDFEKLLEIRKVAEDRGIPLEVLVERAGDTGSDDYEALADSLVMVVDGYDETNIVYELEDQLGDLGYDFWQDYIFITTTDQRLLYGEDVDRFREDILYENPDMDEDEAERQAEEMADEEESRRNNDLVGYIEELGYEGELPNWVAKDYNDAWKHAISYDYDVINYDDQMYVFTNNYSVGGTILSGLVGAYIGYKIGRSKPQKKGFETEKKIGRKIKGAFSKKKYADGGGVEGKMSYERFVETLRDNDKIDGYTGRSSKGMEMYYLPSGHSFLGKKFAHKNKRKAYNEYLSEFKEGGGIGFKGLSDKVAKRYEGKKVAPKYQGEYGKRYSKSEAKEVGNKVAGKVYAQQQNRKMAQGGEILQEISTHKAIKKGDKIYIYLKGLTIKNDDDREFAKKFPDLFKDELLRVIPAENEDDLFYIFENYEETNRYNLSGYARGGNVNTGRSWHLDRARHNKSEPYEKPMSKRKRKYEDGGQIGQEIVFDDSGEENTGVIKDITNLGDYVVKADDGRTLLAQRELDVISLGAMRSAPTEAPRKRFGFFEDGGGVGANQNKQFLNTLDVSYKQRILRNIANHYGISIVEAEEEVTDIESENLYEYITDSTLRMQVYNDMKNRRYDNGGGVENKKTTPSHIVKFKKTFADGGLNTKMRNWYMKTFPQDERGDYMNSYNTFEDLWNALQNKENVYNVIGEGDSLIRERLFDKLSQIKGVKYKDVYNLWLESDDDDYFAKGGSVSGLDDLIRG